MSRLGIELFHENFEKRLDPRNRLYYWQGIDRQVFRKESQVDGTALKEDYITITPIKCDTTDYDLLKDLNQWGFAGML